MEPLRCKPTAFARDEGRVLHSACCGIGFRIDHGQRLVWIRTVKLLETIQCLASDALVAFGLAPVRGLHQEPQFDRAHLRLVSRLAHHFQQSRQEVGWPSDEPDTLNWTSSMRR